MMWLTGRLSPSFKAIASFRKDNIQGIINVWREFVGIRRQLNLFSQAIVAIDGSKFKAVNSGDKNFTPTRMKRRMERVEKHIARILQSLKHPTRQPRQQTKMTPMGSSKNWPGWNARCNVSRSSTTI